MKCSLNNEKLIFELDNKQVEYVKKITEEACQKLDQIFLDEIPNETLITLYEMILKEKMKRGLHD